MFNGCSWVPLGGIPVKLLERWPKDAISSDLSLSRPTYFTKSSCSSFAATWKVPFEGNSTAAELTVGSLVVQATRY